MQYCQPLFFPKRSRLLIWYRIFIHVFALICVIATFSGLWLWIMLLWIGISIAECINHHHDLAFDKTVISFYYHQKTRWVVQISDACFLHMELMKSSVLIQFFATLHFQCVETQTIITVVLWPDSLSTHDFRALQRCMKIGFL